ncbi:MAG TPA: hypothetical protein VFZ66_20480 [Herpetosiphonaceae bacterium]
MTLAHLVYRIASDPSFAAQFVQEPQAAMMASGLVLDDEAAATVLAMLGDRSRIHQLCSLDTSPEAWQWYTPQLKA